MKFASSALLSNRYQLIKELGQGGFAEVWLAQDTQLDNHEIALKIFVAEKGLDESGLALFKKEFLNTRGLHHPNLLVPTHFEVMEGSRIPMLVMTFCEGGSLAGKIDESIEFTEEEIIKIIKQTSAGLAELHSKEVLHRDIKPGNILQDARGNYLLSDFGISSRLSATLTKATTRQSYLTPAYSSPERYSKNPEDITAGDIFSLGVTIYELCSGNLPWSGQGGVMLLKGAEVPSLPEKYSRVLNDMLERCMATVPSQRPTAKELSNWAESYVLVTDRTEPKPIERTGKETVSLESKHVQKVNTTQPVVVATVQVVGKDIRQGSEQPSRKQTSKKDSLKYIITAGMTVILLIVGYFLYTYIKNEQIKEALIIGIQAYEAGDYRAAFASLKLAAENNYTSSYRLLGLLYLRGDGTHQNFPEALKWFQLCDASGDGSAECEYIIGSMHFNGNGVTVNYEEAAKWFQKAIDQNYQNAIYGLAATYDRTERYYDAMILYDQASKLSGDTTLVRYSLENFEIQTWYSSAPFDNDHDEHLKAAIDKVKNRNYSLP